MTEEPSEPEVALNPGLTGRERLVWYIRDMQAEGRQLWTFTDSNATRADITNPQGGPGVHFVAAEGESVWDAIARDTPWLDGSDPPGPFVRMANGSNEFHPRMARPMALMESQKMWLPLIEDEQPYLTEAQSQLVALVRQLQAIARVVQPTEQTMAAFGHEIRNLLILAATEVEMHWRGVLKANGGKKERLNTKDYVRLAGAMRLPEYRVRFHPYPGVELSPFSGWVPEQSTQSLDWYAAYNDVKHNREDQFDRATLSAAFNGIAACSILLVAQFGSDALDRDLKSVLSVETPPWPLEDMYYSQPGEGDWFAISHPALG